MIDPVLLKTGAPLGFVNPAARLPTSRSLECRCTVSSLSLLGCVAGVDWM